MVFYFFEGTERMLFPMLQAKQTPKPKLLQRVRIRVPWLADHNDL